MESRRAGSSAVLTVLAAALVLTSGPSTAAEAPVVLLHDIGVTVLATACGPVRNESFTLPDDAIVTAANFSVSPDLVTTPLLNAQVEVRAGSALVASNTLTTTPLLLGTAGSLDIAGLNAHLLNQTAAAGNVSLGLTVSICPTLGAASVRLDFASLTYVRTALNTSNGTPGNGSGNGSAPAAIVGISVGGTSASTVEALSPLTFAPIVNGSLGADFQFAWFVDGELVGHGATLANLSLAPGEHDITLRASNGSSVQTTTLHVSAAARLPPGGGLLGPAALVALTAAVVVGAVVASTEAGRWLVVRPVAGSVFARLKKASLLDHFVRGTLYQVIRENPGVHFAEVRRRAQVANGVASHHLRMLEKGGYIKVVIDGTKTKFYTTDRALDAEVYGVSDTEKAILTAVTDAPGIGQGELAAKVNRSHSAVSRSVARLVALGYVTTSHEGARVLVFPRQGADGPAPLEPPWPDERD